jgi:hypothetical protein
VPALLGGLAAASVGYGFWLLAPAPFTVRVVALAAAAALAALALLRPRWTLPLLLAAVMVAPVDVAPLVDYSARAAQALEIGAGSRYLAAAYTSALASPLIYASGKEILPIGGFDGRTPVPSVATLRADVASGALHTVLLVPTRDPRVAWVAEHCRIVPTRARIVRTYYCGTPP